MNSAKAIRVARSLAGLSQQALAKRVSLDPSLISMLESGRRKPSLETLERISETLEMPFHLFTLLGAEEEDVRAADPESLNQLAVGLAKLLLGAADRPEPDEHDQNSRKVEHPERKPPRRDATNVKKRTG